MASLSASATTPTSLVFSLPTFTSAFAHILSETHPLTPTDISILLRHLTRDKHLACTQDSPTANTTTIKFAAPHALGPPSPITTHDTTIATLNTLSTSLTSQIVALETRISTMQARTRDALSTNNRTLALSHLRQQKQAEATLAKRIAALDQVTSVLQSIDEAAGQVELVEAMEASGRVLRDLNRQVGGVERVDAVMEDLRGHMEDAEEVGRVIAEVGGERVDEGEVDEEMERLDREEREKRDTVAAAAKAKMVKEEEERGKRERVAVGDMPSVPEGLPVVVVREKGTEKGEEDARKEREIEKRLSTMSIDDAPSPGDRMAEPQTL